ncbi:MAG: endonuclease/exonuclease/phosphatase family protein [Deltaproteobacteria bacterium]|nr:endonuclease/exonuclease/phosphatase family protein [Deltaproteobacteria bacterium]
MNLRVVSYNVRYFGHATKGVASTRGGVTGIARALAGLTPLPEIVCLQEVEATSLRSTLTLERHSASLQLDSFTRALDDAFRARGQTNPYEALYYFAHAHRFSRFKLASMGLAVLVDTRALRIDEHNCATPEHVTHAHVRLLEGRKQKRICAHVRLLLPDGRPLHVFNTHLSLPTPFAKAFWRGARLGHGHNQVAEARKLTRYIESRARHEPLLLAGDFNSPPYSPVFDALTHDTGLVSAQAQLGQIGPHARVFPTAGFFALRMHLDHLFVGNGVRARDLEGTKPFGDDSSPFAGKSDHVPLIARIELA